MEQIERREIVDAAVVVAAAVAAAEQDSGIGTHRRLAHLDVKTIGVEGDFTGDRDAGFVRAEIVLIVAEI